MTNVSVCFTSLQNYTWSTSTLFASKCWALVDRCVILDMLGYRLDLRRLSVAWEPMSSVGIAVRTIDPTSPVDRRCVVA